LPLLLAAAVAVVAVVAVVIVVVEVVVSDVTVGMMRLCADTVSTASSLFRVTYFGLGLKL
jgi:hypothetical protein